MSDEYMLTESAPKRDDRPEERTMHIKVYSPFKVYFDGEGYSLSGKNTTGPFDVLPEHHNFISLLTPGELIIRNRSGDQKMRINGGLLHVRSNRAIVFLDV
jgi:F0F1-type ATP synthase epsilon subunit